MGESDDERGRSEASHFPHGLDLEPKVTFKDNTFLLLYNRNMGKQNTKSKDKEILDNIAETKGVKLVKGRGGYRPNAGRPRGSKNTLTKKAEKKEKTVKERVLKRMDSLLDAQLNLALGERYLYEIKMRNVGGKRKPQHVLIKDPKTIKKFFDGELDEDRYFYINTKPADNKAIDSLLDRALGKAAQGDNKETNFNFNVISYDKKKELKDGTRDITAE